MINEIKELNSKFYEIFDDLKQAGHVLSDEAYLYISEKILEQYKKEYHFLSLRCGIEEDREIDKLQQKHDLLVPHRWRTWFLRRRKKNYAAELLDAEVRQETERIWGLLEKRLDQNDDETGETVAPTNAEEGSLEGDQSDGSEETSTASLNAAEGPSEDDLSGGTGETVTPLNGAEESSEDAQSDEESEDRNEDGIEDERESDGSEERSTEPLNIDENYGIDTQYVIE